jgi:TIR domain/Restriction endonuclease
VTRVYLSYTRADRDIAETIDAALSQAGLGTASRWEVVSRQDWGFAADQAFRPADVVVVVLAPAVGAEPWADSEAEFTLSSDLDRRGVELIPVLAGPADLSPVMRDRAYVDLTADRDFGLRKLVAQIRTVAQIDFDAMSPRGFAALVADLLRALGFRLEGGEPKADLRATFRATDPFGLPDNQVWLVNTKLYGHERVSVDAIKRFAGVLSDAPIDTHGLLVTNTRLTSVAEEYVAEVNRAVSLRVLDGVQLRRLLREFPTVATRHFGGGAKVGTDANP